MGKRILAEEGIKVCGFGHVMDEANSYIRPDTGVAQCRKCQARRVRAWQERHRVERRAVQLKEQWRVDRESSCWNWLGCLDGEGYGQVEVSGKKRKPARILWERVNGALPIGFDLHHTCFNKRCCNPDHLEALTKSAHAKLHARLSPTFAVHLHPNSITTRNKAKTHCPRGHPYDEANTYFIGMGMGAKVGGVASVCERVTGNAQRAKKSGSGACSRLKAGELAVVAGIY